MPLPEEIIQLHTSIDVFDMHCHPSLPVYLFNRKFFGGNNQSRKSLDPLTIGEQMSTDYLRLRGGAVKTLWSSIYVPERGFVADCSGFALLDVLERGHEILTVPPEKLAVRILLAMNKAVADAAEAGAEVGLARTYDQFEYLRANNRIAVIHTLEGAHMLGRGLANRQEYFDNLDRFIDYGVASMTLGHFFDNDICSPVNGFAPSIHELFSCLPTVYNPGKRLTPLGREIVEYMLERGVIVDLNHLTPVGRSEVFEINRARGGRKRPIVFSHIGLRRFCPNEFKTPDDDELRAIADTNGVIGMISMPYWLNGDEHRGPGLDLMVQTAKYVRDKVGIEHVAVGTDFDGFTDPCDDFYDASMFPDLTYALSRGGFTDDEVRAVMGGNARRVLKEGWGPN